MSWDSLRRRALGERKKPPPRPVAEAPQSAPVPTPANEIREIKSFWHTLRRPRPDSLTDCGEVTAIFYFVSDGEVTLCSETGVAKNGKAMKLPAGADEREIAVRLWRAAWITSGEGNSFNRPIAYPRTNY